MKNTLSPYCFHISIISVPVFFMCMLMVSFTTIMYIIFRNFTEFYLSFHLPQVKRSLIFSIKNPLNNLKLKT